MNPVPWKTASIKTAAELFALLASSRDGLPASEAGRRLEAGAANAITGKEVTAREILLRQFRSAFIYLLFAAAAIAMFLGEYFDAGMIFLFLCVNAGLGFYQEFRAEHALAELKSFITRTTRVRREGKESTVPASTIVPGDVVILDAGDMIPADGVFVRADNVTVDESPMTGETVPVTKCAGALAEMPKDIYGAASVGFSRTTLLSGDAELLVIATGVATEVGSIARSMEEAERPSAFQEGIGRFSSFILKLVLATIPLVFLLHTIVHHGEVGVGDFLLFTIALTVSVIPEALPLVTTLSLSRGALRLAKKHVVPRRLSAIEDLGSIEVLCTDKTGTITENRLSVADVFGDRDEVLRLAVMAPCSDPDAKSVQNSVFDQALLAAAGNACARELAGLVRVDERPFDPGRRMESVLVVHEGKSLVVLRGAPERVADAKKNAKLLAWAKAEGQKGRRVLAISWKRVSAKTTTIEAGDEGGAKVIGAVSFADPLKSTAKHAIREAERLGVRVKIVTGDSREVAGWVGKEAGIATSAAEVVTGDELEAMQPEARAVAVEHYDIFARTTPTQKLEIIRLLQEKHLVGFLGEGFNDAPALKAAHVGLAVDKASDIAKDAADVVLLDHSLNVIVDGIKEGRGIFANSMKYLRATLTSNFGNFYALAFSSLFVPFLPMLPIQVLLLNLLSDFPMISIASDSVDESELRRPRGYQVKELTTVAIVLGVVSTLFDFSFFGYFVRFGDAAVLQTMWFVGSILTELVLLFSIRTALPFWKARRPSVLVTGLTSAVIAFTIALPYIPLARDLFGFVLPEPAHMAVALLLVALYFLSTEAAKLLFYRFWNAKSSLHAGL